MAFKNDEDRRAYFRRYYAANRAKRMAVVTANKQRILEYVQVLKIKLGCMDCGYNAHAEALEFDHTGGKVFSISDACRKGYSIERIKEEIKHCDLVCANCHRVRTVSRRVSSISRAAAL